MTHPYLGALAVGYLLQESGVNLQDLFNEMFNLGPPKFDEPVAVQPPSDVSGGDPADVFDPGTDADVGTGVSAIIEEPGTGVDLPPEMEEVLEVAEDTQVLPGAIQEQIIEQEPTVAGMAGQLTTSFPAGTEEAVEAAVSSLTAADLRARRRVRVDPIIRLDPPFDEPVFPTAGGSAETFFLDGVEQL